MNRFVAPGIVVALLAVQAGMIWHGSRRNFVTMDEPGFFAAGISHWETGNFSLYRVNPPLARMLACVPVCAVSHQYDYRSFSDAPGNRPEFPVGKDFIQANASNYFNLIRLARWAGLFWAALGGCVLFLWCRELYGQKAAFLGLLLWCFEPNLMAHAELVTADFPGTVTGLVAAYAFFRYLRDPCWPAALFAGLCLGIALLTKFTNLVHYPIWFLLGLLVFCWTGKNRPSLRFCLRLGHGLSILLFSLFVINAGYGFLKSLPVWGDIPFVSQLFQRHFSPSVHSWLSHMVLPFPEDYIRGIDTQQLDFEAGLPSFLAGQWRDHGWWYYYLFALGIKAPLGILVLFGFGLILTLARHRCCAPFRDELTWLLPGLVFLVVVSSQTGMNHHMRYILPIFPFAIIGASKCAYFVHGRSWWIGLMVIASLGWSVASSMAVYPHSLSYFNEVAGGPKNGYRYLSNSNVDWGQDLLYLQEWLGQNPEARPLHLAYFGMYDPRLMGIEYRLPPFGTSDSGRPTFPPGAELGPGWYAISANYVGGMSFAAPDGSGKYQRVPEQGCSYFQSFQPVDWDGYGILIYHLDQDDIDRLRE